jgi:hypothetical protein
MVCPRFRPLQVWRLTRRSDECRRKKIKCDGKQPCTHCTVYSYGKSSCATPTPCAIAIAIITRRRLHLRPALQQTAHRRAPVH